MLPWQFWSDVQFGEVDMSVCQSQFRALILLILLPGLYSARNVALETHKLLPISHRGFQEFV